MKNEEIKKVLINKEVTLNIQNKRVKIFINKLEEENLFKVDFNVLGNEKLPFDLGNDIIYTSKTMEEALINLESIVGLMIFKNRELNNKKIEVVSL